MTWQLLAIHADQPLAFNPKPKIFMVNTKSFLHWSNRYAKQTEHNGINMTLIGGWSDLAAYYSGSDGNVWTYQMGWSNQGPIDEFKSRFEAGRYRGELL